MNLSKTEKIKIEKLYKMLDEANSMIESTYKRLMKMDSKSYAKLDGSAIDMIDVINNEKIQDKKLIGLINYRNKIRKKYNDIANRIWEVRSAEEVQHEEF